MSDEDFIIELFCRIDDTLKDVPKHTQASLYPSEVITLALFGQWERFGSERDFYRYASQHLRARGYFPARRASVQRRHHMTRAAHKGGEFEPNAFVLAAAIADVAEGAAGLVKRAAGGAHHDESQGGNRRRQRFKKDEYPYAQGRGRQVGVADPATVHSGP